MKMLDVCRLLVVSIFGCLMASCAAEPVESPERVEDPVSRSCSLSSANKGGFINNMSCCFGASPTCYVTGTSGGVIETLNNQPSYGPHMFSEAEPFGYWVASPADLFENRYAECAALSVVPSASVSSRCYISRSIVRRPLGEEPYLRTIKFKPAQRERAFWHGASDMPACDYVFEPLPASQCP